MSEKIRVTKEWAILPCIEEYLLEVLPSMSAKGWEIHSVCPEGFALFSKNQRYIIAASREIAEENDEHSADPANH